MAFICPLDIVLHSWSVISPLTQMSDFTHCLVVGRCCYAAVDVPSCSLVSSGMLTFFFLLFLSFFFGFVFCFLCVWSQVLLAAALTPVKGLLKGTKNTHMRMCVVSVQGCAFSTHTWWMDIFTRCILVKLFLLKCFIRYFRSSPHALLFLMFLHQITQSNNLLLASYLTFAHMATALAPGNYV